MTTRILIPDLFLSLLFFDPTLGPLWAFALNAKEGFGFQYVEANNDSRSMVQEGAMTEVGLFLGEGALGPLLLCGIGTEATTGEEGEDVSDSV